VIGQVCDLSQLKILERMYVLIQLVALAVSQRRGQSGRDSLIAFAVRSRLPLNPITSWTAARRTSHYERVTGRHGRWVFGLISFLL
jgi:hypothetical protein